ncbi:tRNA (adenine(58)-N(1))-methyltransferase non-catalytic subunit trm6-like [Zingiber officinale]|uniref:tRNA (adenine(58)-N(1))-methyltransferase non-catalytic subunit trm6-like n=1 Tax=Zingiber officinale TaxID=94328 RepID=UPI001C4B77F7|nr:tRNA (adenine(58)-N(1))-methyltransferase non-catalytic subunit trm6-like [Zingiber officinale]
MAQDHSADAVAVAAAECQHLAATSPPTNPKTTWEGCSVLLDINDGDRLVFARLSPAATLKIGNKKCSLGPLLGCPFGSLFRVGNGPGEPCLSRCSHSTSGASDNALQAIEEESIAEDSRDNRLLIDNNTAQNLSSDDIDAMRRNGATGDEIVEALISNSATFKKKTVYSQEKYKRKKQKKYAPKVLLRKPSARSICETYFKKFPARIGFLRVDTLSLLLSMANVGVHSDVLVVDMIGGMVTGAVAERLGGTGYICSTYFGVTPYPSDIIRMFNFNSEVYSRIVHVPVSDLSKSLDDFVHSEISAKAPSMLPESAECRNSMDISEVPIQNFDLIKEKSLNNEQTSVMSDVGESQHVASILCPSGANDLELGHDTPITDKLVNKGRQAPLETMKQWKTNGFSGLIVAAPEAEVGTIVHKLLPLLAYSAPFAIYHQYLQPLAACMHNLQTSKLAISLQISEPWLREYQVLPSRTHPLMQMSSFGGYILSGIRIRNSVPSSI